MVDPKMNNTIDLRPHLERRQREEIDREFLLIEAKAGNDVIKRCELLAAKIDEWLARRDPPRSRSLLEFSKKELSRFLRGDKWDGDRFQTELKAITRVG